MYMDFEIFFGFNEAWNENIAVALFRTHEWHTVAASCQTFIYVHKFDKTFFVYGWREYEIRNRLFVFTLRFIRTIKVPSILFLFFPNYHLLKRIAMRKNRYAFLFI